MASNPTDPVIDEVRAVRHRISEEHGHDPARLVAHYIRLQEQYRDRLIEAAERREDTDRDVVAVPPTQR